MPVLSLAGKSTNLLDLIFDVQSLTVDVAHPFFWNYTEVLQTYRLGQEKVIKFAAEAVLRTLVTDRGTLRVFINNGENDRR